MHCWSSVTFNFSIHFSQHTFIVIQTNERCIKKTIRMSIRCSFYSLWNFLLCEVCVFSILSIDPTYNKRRNYQNYQCNELIATTITIKNKYKKKIGQKQRLSKHKSPNGCGFSHFTSSNASSSNNNNILHIQIMRRNKY